MIEKQSRNPVIMKVIKKDAKGKEITIPTSYWKCDCGNLVNYVEWCSQYDMCVDCYCEQTSDEHFRLGDALDRSELILEDR